MFRWLSIVFCDFQKTNAPDDISLICERKHSKPYAIKRESSNTTENPQVQKRFFPHSDWILPRFPVSKMFSIHDALMFTIGNIIECLPKGVKDSILQKYLGSNILLWCNWQRVFKILYVGVRILYLYNSVCVSYFPVDLFLSLTIIVIIKLCPTGVKKKRVTNLNTAVLKAFTSQLLANEQKERTMFFWKTVISSELSIVKPVKSQLCSLISCLSTWYVYVLNRSEWSLRLANCERFINESYK